MFTALIAAGFIVGEYVYHRWFQDQPPKPNPGHTITLPAAQSGAVIPLFYGRIRVKAPIMAWWGNPDAFAGSDFGTPAAQFLYGVDMFFNVGISFDDAINRFHGIYVGEFLLPLVGDQTGAGGRETPYITDNTGGPPGQHSAGFIGGQIEFLNGHPGQQLVDPGSLTSTTHSADRMIAYGLAPQVIPGYRGYASIMLFGDSDLAPWIIGPTQQPDAYSFEMSGYPDGGSPLIPGGGGTFDVNPVDVIYDLFQGAFSKLGLDPDSRLDLVSFTRVRDQLQAEGHGFSRSWETGSKCGDKLDEIMKQIDGVYYEDPVDGKIHIKLIRPDYDPTTIPVINPTNCMSLDNVAAGGWTDLPTMIQVGFTERANHYRAGSAVALNQAGAVGQDGEIRTIQLEFPGVMIQATANDIAGRELAARTRPLMKMRAMCSRDFYRTTIGDVVMVTWPEANISRQVFRVAAVSRGTLEDGTIALDLIQDYFYQWRNFRPVSPVPPIGGILG